MTPAPLTGRAAFRKNDGVVAVATDGLTVTWTPNPGTGSPTVSLSVADISNLQQTPDSNPKVMLKILARTSPDAEQPESFVFHFNTPEGRAEANAIKDVIAKRISDLRTSDPGVTRLVAQTAAADAAPAWVDDARLRTDIELQHSLMKKEKTLHQTYMAAHQAKPDSISDAAFNSQFWSTRTNLLRAHAVETSQKKGSYHVLAVVKPKAVENEGLKLSINVEQVQLILSQHPLVKRLYDENVPRMSEGDFWSKFFLSRLRKRLCGEELLATDKAVPLFDRPEFDGEEALLRSDRDDDAFHVPRTIDVEANEENQGGFRSGNRKDVEMRPRKKARIMGVLNSVSEKIMAGVTPADSRRKPDQDAAAAAAAGAGAGVDEDQDEDTIRELALRDLAAAQEEHRIILNVKQQRSFFATGRDSAAPSANAAAFAKQDPAEVLASMQAALNRLPTDSAGGINMHAAIGFNPQSDSEDDDGDDNEKNKKAQSRKAHVGSRAALKAAYEDVVARISQRRGELYGAEDDSQLSPELVERCTLTNASTTEFLRQFWAAFLSGDPDRATELQYVVEALGRSVERIDAISADAERAREAVVTQKKKDVRAYFERTGKKARWNADMVRGGRAAVEALLGSTLEAVAKARGDYQRAYEAEMAQQQLLVQVEDG